MKKFLFIILLLTPGTSYLMERRQSEATITEEVYEEIYLGKAKCKKLKRSPKCSNLAKLFRKLLKKKRSRKMSEEVKHETKRLEDYLKDLENYLE